jgi:hypothetical protein
VEDAQLHGAESQPLAVPEPAVREAGVGRLVEGEAGAGARGQLAIARDVVGVDVGVDHVGDRQPARAGERDVVVHVGVGRIDDRGHARPLAADQVADAAGRLVRERLEDHRDVSSLSRWW